MLQARNIHKRFGDLEVLKGIDICIPQGKVTAIVGPSGAGKTTLLRIIMGELEADGGEVVLAKNKTIGYLPQILGTLSAPEAGGSVTYDSVEVTAMNDRRLSRFRNRNIGFVFQFHQLLPEFTLLENVALPAMIAGTARKEAENKAADLLERLGLADRAGHRPDQLSGGECQRAAVARALVNNPQIILADEPTGSLDSTNRQALHSLFYELRDRLGATFAIVTHDEQLAADADLIVRMADGKIVGTTAKA